jgi:uncharacterized membrane protein YoaK (UPF0700 family)
MIFQATSGGRLGTLERNMAGLKKGSAKATAPAPASSDSSPVDIRSLVGHYVHGGIGVLLVALAGYVDAIGYIALGGFFASFMSGASISLGVGLSEGDWGAVQAAALVIAAFLASAVVATIIAGIVGIWALPIVLLLEAGLLAGAVALAASGQSLSISILPVVAAMGVQNTALHPVEGVRLGVTFMTGTLVSLGQGIGRAFLGRNRTRNWFPHAFLWCTFVTGAGAGAFLYSKYGFVAVAGPAALAAAAALVLAIILVFKRSMGSIVGSRSRA